ncbi:MAG: type IV pili twitching motility protein PilT [Elusimicrobia bacterium RIFOXYA2_FULL_39_19]|nr:MAG: type IV pili twitching motility protein PilT [Elusimicrobia bacterium RIFOXYA2_FULL_39_19]
MVNMQDLLLLMVEKNASDLHITTGLPPMLRVDGELIPTQYEKMTSDISQRLIYSLLTDTQKEKFEANNELDLSFGIKGVGRVRMNVYRQRGSIGAAFRSISNKIPNFEELGLPPIAYEVMKIPKGLILVTGPTGSGKSTTLASMIDFLNEHNQSHILTIEDPIEYIHLHKKSVVNQREVGTDTNSFPLALKYVLRQDPDIILVGEMRDLETIQAAITIAETGHLVFATLHTTDAASSINRMVDVFPPHQQAQVRSQLSFTLQAVFSQILIPHASGTGRCLGCEVLIVTPGIRNLIRDLKTEQIALAMQTGGKFGMQTMNMCLANLYLKRQITYQEALMHTSDMEDLKRLIQKENTSVPKY